MATPAVAETGMAGDSLAASLPAAMIATGLEPAGGGGEHGRGALGDAGHKLALDGRAAADLPGGPTANELRAEAGITHAAFPAFPLAGLAHGTELPAMALPSFADAVAMPSSGMLRAGAGRRPAKSG